VSGELREPGGSGDQGGSNRFRTGEIEAMVLYGDIGTLLPKKSDIGKEVHLLADTPEKPGIT